MITVISLLDDRARPKGSRDALGAEAIWSHLGRKLVGNLTTVTSNLDNFMVALLCCHYAHDGGPDRQSDEVIQERYLSMEQVAAYLKLANQTSTGFLGITRARKNFADTRIRLGTAPDAQLLANQAGYGLWGLYSSALEAAGLISGDRRLSPGGTALAGTIIAQFGRANWQSLCGLAGASWLDKAATGALAPQFSMTLSDSSLRASVVHGLLASQRDCLLQAELFPLAQAFLTSQRDGHFGQFCSWVLDHEGASPALKLAIKRIVAIDPLLSLADIVMLWLQTKPGEPLASLVPALQPYLADLSFSDVWQDDADLPHRDFLKRLRIAAMQADAEALIRLVLEQNRTLMRARGGAAWIEIDGASRLVVRVRNDHPQDLNDLQTSDTRWRYNYFLFSFLMITQQGQT